MCQNFVLNSVWINMNKKIDCHEIRKLNCGCCFFVRSNSFVHATQGSSGLSLMNAISLVSEKIGKSSLTQLKQWNSYHFYTHYFIEQSKRIYDKQQTLIVHHFFVLSIDWKCRHSCSSCYRTPSKYSLSSWLLTAPGECLAAYKTAWISNRF